MEIEVKRLIALGKFTGNFSYDYVPPQDCCLIPLCRVDGGVQVSGEYEIFDDDSVEFRLTVKYKLVGQCSYCLNSAEKDVVFTQDVLFVTEADNDNYEYDGFKIDLKTAVDDAILISQPQILLCKEDCEGIDVT